MNSQRKKLEQQLAHVVEEMQAISQKSQRLQYRYSQLLKEKQALEQDLQETSNQTTKRVDLKSTQVRKMNLLSKKEQSQ